MGGCPVTDLSPTIRAKNSKQNEASRGIHAEMVIELNDRIDELNGENEKLRKVIRDNKAGEKDTKKEVQNLKYDNKRLQMDSKDMQNKFENVKKEY